MKPYAVFTIVHNEPVFLRLWCNYYCGFSPSVDVFVLDDASSDASVEDAKVRFPNVVFRTVPSGRRYDLARLRESVQAFQRELLKSYEVVVYTDVDEFLLTWTGDFLQFLEGFRLSGRSQARASGWHCVHEAGEEPLSLVDGESVLKNRRSMRRLTRYDKVLVSKAGLSWTNGFHSCVGAGPLKPDPNLVLFHAWMIDQDLFLKKERPYAGPNSQRLADAHRLGRKHLGPRDDIPDQWKPLLRW